MNTFNHIHTLSFHCHEIYVLPLPPSSLFPTLNVVCYLHKAFLHCAYIAILHTVLVHSPGSSPLPSFPSPLLLHLTFTLSLTLTLFVPLSHDLPTDQVYLYDGTQSCQAANFVPFLVLAVLISFCFVFVAPFLLCLLTKKRWTVSSLHAHCSIFNSVLPVSFLG